MGKNKVNSLVAHSKHWSDMVKPILRLAVLFYGCPDSKWFHIHPVQNDFKVCPVTWASYWDIGFHSPSFPSFSIFCRTADRRRSKECFVNRGLCFCKFLLVETFSRSVELDLLLWLSTLILQCRSIEA